MEPLNQVTVTEDFRNRIWEATKAVSEPATDDGKLRELCEDVCRQIDAITRCKYIENGEPTELLEIIWRDGWMETLQQRQHERRLKAMSNGKKRSRIDMLLLKADFTKMRRVLYREERVMDHLLGICISDETMNLLHQYAKRTGERRPFLKNKLLQIRILRYLYKEVKKGATEIPPAHLHKGMRSFISARIISKDLLWAVNKPGGDLHCYDNEKNFIRYLMRETGFYQTFSLTEEELEALVEEESKALLAEMDRFLDDDLEGIIDFFMKENRFQNPRRAYLAVYPRIRGIRLESPKPCWFDSISDICVAIEERNITKEVKYQYKPTFKVFVEQVKEQWKHEQEREALIRSGLTG